MSKSRWQAWGPPAEPVGQVALGFGGTIEHEALRNMSAGTRIGDTLFVAADEHCGIDRLCLVDEKWCNHATFVLKDMLDLEEPDEEADLEGLSAENGWLWAVGSHARTRYKPEKFAGETIDLTKLADLKDTRARCLLARFPLVETAQGWQPVARDGGRRAGMLKQGKRGNSLMKMLKEDPLLAPFTRIPAKEGGLDVEGLAVAGDRVALGMRGPVIATHAVLLEMRISAGKSGQLRIEDGPYKRLMAMEGLGIRDLKRCGGDLLILAGPTTGLSGPVALYRWRDWVNDPPQDENKVRLHRPERILELPFGRGVDHPEGLALWAEDQILVICDSPAPERVDAERGTIMADLFKLPR